jgi:hydroxymethylglutaryl-CoA lyase
MADGRDLRGGAAGRAPERGADDPGRGEDRAGRLPVGRGVPADRGGELREPEAGAADGRRGGGAPGIRRAPGVSYAALVPNLVGFERAMEAGADEIAIFASASEGFSRANLNCSIAESLERFRPVAEAAMRGCAAARLCLLRRGMPLRRAGGAGKRWRMWWRALRDGGLRGVARRHDRARGARDGGGAMLDAVLGVADARAARGAFPRHRGAGARQCGGVARQGLARVRRGGRRAWRLPLRAGGAGNVATEAVHDRLAALGFETGLDRAVLGRAAEMARAMRHG